MFNLKHVKKLWNLIRRRTVGKLLKIFLRTISQYRRSFTWTKSGSGVERRLGKFILSRGVCRGFSPDDLPRRSRAIVIGKARTIYERARLGIFSEPMPFTRFTRIFSVLGNWFGLSHTDTDSGIKFVYRRELWNSCHARPERDHNFLKLFWKLYFWSKVRYRGGFILIANHFSVKNLR